MKAFLFSCFIVFSLALPTQEALNLFNDFKSTFGRRYATPEEETKRFACFQETLQLIAKRNAQDEGATHVVNKFADLCQDEFRKMYLNRKSMNLTIPVVEPTLQAPTSFDWRTQGAVNHIKDQSQCGSCWAFSAVAAMEGAWKLAKGQLLSLSEEELVQCAKSAGDGCNGGDMGPAISWVVSNGGINSESAYPYTSGNGITGSCNHAKASVSVAKFSGFIRCASEAKLEAFLVQHGPLSIAVDANDWSSYGGGIKTSCGGRSLDHGVALIGYSASGTTKYWIVRNSWGVTWGESGYIRLKHGVNCDGMVSEGPIAAKV